MIRAILFSAAILANLSIYAQCNINTIKQAESSMAASGVYKLFNSTQLIAGESAGLIRQFYSEQMYRIAIVSEGSTLDIEFEISDLDGNVRFSNKDHNLTRSWDFIPNQNEQLFISVKFPENGSNSDLALSECVTVMIAYPGS